MSKQVMNRKYKWLNLLLYILSSALFMSSDFSFNESLRVKINLFLIFFAIVSLIAGFRLILEVFIITFSAYCFKDENISGRNVLSYYLDLCIIPALGNFMGFLIQMFFIRQENDTFQTIWITIIQSIFYIFLFIRIKKPEQKKGVHIVMICYYFIYIAMQVNSLL